MAQLGTPLELPCGLVLRNRVVRAAAFAGGTVAEQAAVHAEVAAGGVAMTTVAYTAVAADGRTFAAQLLLTPQGAPPDLADIARAVHAHGALLCVQLTHAGGFASRELLQQQQQQQPAGGDADVDAGVPLAPSAAWDPASPWRRVRAATEAEIARLTTDFATAAAIAVGAGEADAVEVHLGHGYLLSQWLCPALNWRTDGHGGAHDAAARLRFPLAVVRAVRAAIGPKRALFVKLNVDDGFPGGVTPADVATTVRALCAEPGLVDGVVPSAGFVSRNGFFMLRGTVPRAGMVRALARSSSVKSWACALLGRWLVPELPFEPRFLADGARAVLATVAASPCPALPVLPVGGYTDRAHVDAALAEGFAGVQMARALIREPDLIARWLAADEAAGKARGVQADGSGSGPDALRGKCIHCNVCVLAALTPEVPARCPERPTPPDIEDLQT